MTTDFDHLISSRPDLRKVVATMPPETFKTFVAQLPRQKGRTYLSPYAHLMDQEMGLAGPSPTARSVDTQLVLSAAGFRAERVPSSGRAVPSAVKPRATCLSPHAHLLDEKMGLSKPNGASRNEGTRLILSAAGAQSDRQGMSAQDHAALRIGLTAAGFGL